jgi:transketolase N-terminal domain/subunit
MGFNIHILSARRPSQNLAHHAAVAASFNLEASVRSLGRGLGVANGDLT